METVQSAARFIAFMGRVWNDESEPAPDGGVTLRVSNLYDDWHDAIRSAHRLGGRKLNPQKRNDEYGYAFEFADGTRAWVATHGGACREIQRHRSAY